MTTMTIFSLAPGRGRRAARRLEGFGALRVPVHDAAVVEWPPGAPRPEAWQVVSRHDPLALTGAFWGMLFAHLVLIPLSRIQSPALGPALPDPSLDHLGLTEAALAPVREAVHRGSSALFVLHPDDATDAVLAALAPARTGAPAASVRLGEDQQRRLYAAFGAETPEPTGVA